MRPDPFAGGLTSARRDRLRSVLAARHDASAMIVSDLRNVRYLSGFDGSNGALLVTADDAALFTDSRYVLQAAAQAPGVDVVEARDPVAEALGMVGTKQALLEGHDLSAARWQAISTEHGSALLVPDLVAGLRAIKDDAEIGVLEEACRISAQALTGLLGDGVLGRTERDVARRLEWLLGLGDGEGPGFPSIVATGPNSALPHHRPTSRPIGRGDLLKIDFGARVAGYHADITRTFVVGADPLPWQRDIHALVARAQEAGRSAAGTGVRIADVDAAARGLIAGAGYGPCFGHGLGHGVGLDVHERPLISAASEGTLESGMAITIEPGIYLPGLGGIRIEDTVLVGPQGCRPLVALARELVTVQ